MSDKKNPTLVDATSKEKSMSERILEIINYLLCFAPIAIFLGLSKPSTCRCRWAWRRCPPWPWCRWRIFMWWRGTF
eukprot:jgi/Botrbrau1/1065/Bobra.0076s0031.1